MAMAQVAATAATKGKQKLEQKKQEHKEVKKARQDADLAARKKPDRRTVSEKTQDRGGRLIGNRPRYWEPRSVAGYRRILTAEFLLCVGVILWKAWKNKSIDEGFWKRLGAVWVVFFILSLVSSANWKIARIAAMLGGIITLGMGLKESDLLTGAANLVTSATGTTQSQEAPTNAPPGVGGPNGV